METVIKGTIGIEVRGMIKEGASMMIMTVIKAAIMTGYHILTDFIHLLINKTIGTSQWKKGTIGYKIYLHILTCGPFLTIVALWNLFNVNPI